MVRPSKFVSAFTVLVGVMLIFFVLLVIIPVAGVIGWLLMVLILLSTGYFAYNIVAPAGVAELEFDMLPSSNPSTAKWDVQKRLQTLDDLKKKGLVSEREYLQKKKEILDSL